MSDGSSDDEDYDAFHDAHPVGEKRYPLHDCCEFEDVKALRELIYIEVEESDDDEEEQEERPSPNQGGNDSSSDDNDSTAAAHAAAIGHSPQPIKQVVPLPTVAEGLPLSERKEEPRHEVSADQKTGESSESGPIKSTQETSQHVNEIQATAHTQTKEELPTPMDVDEDKPQSTPETPEEKKTKENGNGVGAASAPITQTEQVKRKRLEVDPDVHLNERDDDENTALHIAILARKIEHVKVLLEAGASFRLRCDGSFPIHTAISMGSIATHRQFTYECVVALHEHGADLTVKDDCLHTPLFLSCMYNLPQVASYILSTDDGLASLNTRADRAGNRPLHAAAKYDTLDNASLSKSAVASATGQLRPVQHHHPDGTLVNATHAIPGFPGKLEQSAIAPATPELPAPAATTSPDALLTQVLLGTNGIELDAVNVLGQTPLHIACARGNWAVARLLLQAGASTTIADRRGYTPGQLSYKRGMPIPNDLLDVLGDPPEAGTMPPPRDLILDPNSSTLLLCHELCLLHRTCPPIRRNSLDPPPENVRRLHVLVDKETGILRSGEFSSLTWKGEARRAAMADILKIHDYQYVESISRVTSAIPDHPNAIAHLDPDTAISRWSFEAALRAAGSVCEAVDMLVAGECRNAFCAVRPPGHHAGPRGIVRCANDPEGGSHGFCLFNNVAIGAAYARSVYRNEGIRKIAIVDFDVHHGNGTEEVIRQLVPDTEKVTIQTPFASGELSTSTYRPWLDETDIQNVFFASTHGYGNRGFDQPGWFYPASGKTHTSEAITHPAMVETPSLTDFILSQTWARMGEDSKTNCCKIMDIGLDLPEPDVDQQSRSMKQRLELRDSYRKKVFPHLREFDPDLIFISAGFDAHRRDSMNFGYVGMVEDDYEWITEQLVKIANTCCNGRVISVLEGGYKIHGGIVSPFARSVASHVRALVDGGRSRELYDGTDCEWEGQFERQLFEKRERKKEQEREQLRLIEEANRRSLLEDWTAAGDAPEDPDAPSRKRRRNQVDYKELFKQMQQEGFAG